MGKRALWRAALTGCAIIISTASCGESSSPDAAPHVTVTFQRSPVSGQIAPDSATITATGAEVHVTGLMMTGDGCRVIKGDLSVSGGRVQLTMRTESDGSQSCTAVVARFGYVAAIAGVGSGTWTVDVRHLAYGTGGAETIATQTVVIP